jgi:hypothetical protein
MRTLMAVAALAVFCPAPAFAEGGLQAEPSAVTLRAEIAGVAEDVATLQDLVRLMFEGHVRMERVQEQLNEEIAELRLRLGKHLRAQEVEVEQRSR